MRDFARFEPDAPALRVFATALAGAGAQPRVSAQAADALVEAGIAAARRLGPPYARLDLARVYCAIIRQNRRMALAADPPGAGEAVTGAEFMAALAAARAASPQDALMRQSIAGLALEQREILLMVTLAGFSHVETAQALELPLAGVVARLAKARAALTHLLAHGHEDEGVAPPAPRRAGHLRLVK